MTQEIKITRFGVVTVAKSELDQYGNLFFTDTQGNSHKLGSKRSNLFDLIIDGRAVKLGYAVYKNKKYISTAQTLFF